MMSDEELILQALSDGDRLTLAELQFKSRLSIERVREAVMVLQSSKRIDHQPNPTERWKQTWSKANR